MDEELESQEDSPKTELEQISMDLADVVDCLLRLSVAISNPAPHDRFVQSLSSETSHFERYDIEHVQSKFASIDLRLADRLGKAISRRRQYFRYREAHHAKLSYRLDQAGAAGAAGSTTQTVASSIPDHLKETIDMTNLVLADDHSEAGVSQTSYATSAADGAELRVPPLPEVASKGPFECPFCYRIVDISSKTSWK